MRDGVTIRGHGAADLPTLIYLPGVHGDWTLVSSFRQAAAGRVRFVDMTYPRTTSWSLDDYARAIEEQLLNHGITDGWLIGESFGSQPAWQMIARAFQREGTGAKGFQPSGLILVGGFVKHPWKRGVNFLCFVSRRAPRWLLRGFLIGYARYAWFRHRQAPETLACIREFIANRRDPCDAPAMQHRYRLIADSDVCGAARAMRLPVYHLGGLVDPLVPFWSVRRWLRGNCPGYRESRLVLAADHNVLGTAPRRSAEIILGWMKAEKTRAECCAEHSSA